MRAKKMIDFPRLEQTKTIYWYTTTLAVAAGELRSGETYSFGNGPHGSRSRRIGRRNSMNIQPSLIHAIPLQIQPSAFECRAKR